MNAGRLYSKGEQPHEVFRNFHGANQYNRYFYIRVGEILEIDYDRYRMKIQWTTGSGSPAWIPISFPYAGPSGCMGSIPEEHSLGIFGFYDEGHGKGAPLLLSYLPPAMSASLQHNAVKFNPDAIPNEDENIVQYRFRKLSEGDMIMSSSLGGQILVNGNVEVSDAMHDSILFRQSDQSIINTSLNHFIFADGASVHAGAIIRNKANIFDAQGKRIENINTREITTPDGRDVIYMVPFGASIEYDTQFYTEYRVDVDERGDGILDTNDINGYSATTRRDPIVTMVMGNYAGAKQDNKRYGVMLRPVLFSSRTDKVGKFDLIQCSQKKGADEIANLGLAYALHFHKSGTFLGVDKEGHYYMNLGASMSNPLGNGRSMSILAQGNLKEIWGFEADSGNSWDFVARGGVKWDIGAHNTKEKTRSIDIRTSSGAYYEYGANDESGSAKAETVFGNASEYVQGYKTIEVGQEYNLTVDGLKTERIRGSANSEFNVDNTVNVLGVFTEIAVKEKQCRFGQRKTTISTGSDELTIVKGNLEETIQTFGNRMTTIQGKGNIEESITVGDRTTTIKLGNCEIDILKGDITIKTKIGNVEMDGGLKASLLGKVKTIVKAASVLIGNGPAKSGMVTGAGPMPSHFDYVTGAPIKGLPTVKAG